MSGFQPTGENTMTTLFARPDQTHCSECGQKFVPDRTPTEDRPVTATTCPDGCRGSWAQLTPDDEHTTEL